MHLLNLLNGFNKHPALRGKLALKGGTALNLFIFDVPRLSVDIDLNYIGSTSRDEMIAERPGIEKAVEAVCLRENLSMAKTPSEHAGGKWRLRYRNADGGGGNIEIDLNFMFRTPLAPTIRLDSALIGGLKAENFTVLNIHEIAAGKLAALLSRRAGRDLYDVCALFDSNLLDMETLRVLFTAYGGMNRKDFRKASMDEAVFDPLELRNQLLPVLRRREKDKIENLTEWAAKLCDKCRSGLSRLLPFRENELEFLNLLLEKGQIRGELLTQDHSLAKTISSHPLLEWKAINVRRHGGIHK